MNLDVFQELRVECDGVALKVPAVSDAVAAAQLVAAGLYASSEAVTIGDWYDPAQPLASARRSISYQIGCWTGPGPLTELPFSVIVDGQVVGAQGLHANAPFAITREFFTGSWIGRGYRGAGIGTRARWCALHLAFQVLGALTVRSEASLDNAASQRVSTKCGYEPDGTSVAVNGPTQVRLEAIRFRHDRDRWLAVPRPQITAVGVAELAALVGAAATAHHR